METKDDADPEDVQVKDLDSGKTYHINEIDKHYKLITLDDIAQIDHYPNSW